MSNVFKTSRESVQEMCDDYKSITGITLSPDNFDDSTVIKFWGFAGALSSVTSTIQLAVNDFFPATASIEALRKHLRSRSLPAQILAQKSHGQLQFTLTGPATITIGTQVKRVSDGALFTCVQEGVGTGPGVLNLYFESVDTGNDKNLDSLNQPFAFLSPISNVMSTAQNSSLFFDGRDIETAVEMYNRITAHDQDDNSGGNEVAYELWAKDASNEVVTAKCLRKVRGPDTVDVIITSGTSDIAAAVEIGQPVSRLPSAPLVTLVQNYVATLNPVTDDVLVKAPYEIVFNTALSFNLYDETPGNRSYVMGQIKKVWQTYVYSARPLDKLSPTDLERLIDKRVGDLIKERKVENFAGLISTYTIPADSILTPGSLTQNVL